MVLTESNYETNRRGSIEVICGSMFSGKTEELIRRLKRAKIARQRVEIFKPAIDVRYSEENIVSHRGSMSWESMRRNFSMKVLSRFVPNWPITGQG